VQYTSRLHHSGAMAVVKLFDSKLRTNDRLYRATMIPGLLIVSRPLSITTVIPLRAHNSFGCE
jgi:hypothetical protein